MLLLVTSVLTHAYAATPGAPLPPRPGPLPRHWGTWSNDAFGGEIRSNPDDLRTNSFAAGLRFSDRWISEIDLSILTNKDGIGGTPPSRSDELTVAFGYLVDHYREPNGHFMFAAGVGLRHADDFGMGDIQNEWHDVIDFKRIDPPYDHAATTGFGWASWQWVGLTDMPIPTGDSIFSDGSRFGILLEGQALMTVHGEMQSEMSTGVMWAGKDSAIWAGYQHVFRAGETLSQTAQVVAESEEGGWLTYGISVGSIVFTGEVDLNSSLSTGTIGWMYQRQAMHAHTGDDVFTGEFGTTLNSYGLGGAARWAPYWMQEIPFIGKHINLQLDYRYGRVPDVNVIDTSVRYQQLSSGIDITMLAPTDGLQINPFIGLALGWRIEDIQREGNLSPFLGQQEESLAFLSSIGIRTTWGSRPSQGEGIQYGASLSFDRWDALGDQVIESPVTDDEITILDENYSISLRVMASIGW